VDEGQPYAPGGFPVGSEIAGYQIEEQVGRGGMAVVYRATDARLQRTVALKVLAPELARDAAFRERFIREMRAAAAVNHPHIVPVFDAGEANGALYIAMLYASGHDVRTLIATQGPLPAARVADIIGQMASALDAAHSRDLIHRDVKPGNMLIASLAGNGHPDHVYLSDFGLSKQSFSSPSLTLTGQFLGTIDYMAPEQVEGSPIDGRADLYALACAAFEMFTGAPPFKRDQNFAVIWAQLSAPAPSLASQRPDLSPAVDQVLAKALAKSPDDRYTTCGEFAAALHAACVPSAAVAAFGPPHSQAYGPAMGPAVGAALRPALGAADEEGWRVPRMADPEDWRVPGSEPPTTRLGASGPPDPSDASPTMRMGPPGQAPPRRDLPERPEPNFTLDDLFRPAEPQPPNWQAGPPPRQPYRGARDPRSRSHGAAIAGGVAACVLILVIAGVLFVMLRGHTSTPPQSKTQTQPPTSSPTSQQVAAAPPSPAVTVQSYFSAINNHNYQRAWALGGKNTGVSYATFVQGFDQTASDNLTVVSVSGNVVTVLLDATQTNGTVKHFHGTYTVTDGVITVSNIRAGA
jgi:tRNA A-37 threonylcarbamoyl transferase component Bud32